MLPMTSIAIATTDVPVLYQGVLRRRLDYCSWIYRNLHCKEGQDESEFCIHGQSRIALYIRHIEPCTVLVPVEPRELEYNASTRQHCIGLLVAAIDWP